MKKRQEIQQEINNLNQQLRQHQIEQRNKQQSKNSSSMDDMVAGTSNTSKKKDTGLSQASMQAMISALVKLLISFLFLMAVRMDQ